MGLTDSKEEGGDFMCVPKSHKYHHAYFKGKKMLNHKDNWFIIPDSDKNKESLNNILKVNS